MCFEQGVMRGGSVVARILAASLSSKTVDILDCESISRESVSMNSLSMLRMGIKERIAVEKVIYSASMIERATSNCILLAQ